MLDVNRATNQQSSPRLTLFIVSFVQFMIPFLMSSTYVALPTIGRDLHASAVQLSMTVTVLVLAIAMVVLPMGRFADIYGRKKVFITGIVVLVISSFSLAMSNSIQIFLFFRFIQGIGCAMIFSTSIAILTAVFPKKQRGQAMGVIVSMVYFGMSLGPFLSGFIIHYLGWRWVFFFISTCILTTLILTLARLKGEWKTAAGEPFDYSGAALYMLSLALLVYGASNLTKNNLAKWLLAGGIIGLALFTILEKKAIYPLLDIQLLQENLTFTFSNLATFLNYTSVTSFIFLFSLYLQYGKGFSAKEAGVLLIVQPIVQAFLAPLTGRFSDRYPPTNIATIGMGICTVGLLSSAVITRETSLLYIIMVLIILGISLGIFSTSNMTAIMNSVGPRHHGTAASMVSTMRTLGMLCSATIIAMVLLVYLGNSPVTEKNTPAFITSMQTSLFFFAALSLLATIFSMVKGRLAGSISTRKD